jgi:membrane protein YdbS with pleckstrin-like domain
MPTNIQEHQPLFSEFIIKKSIPTLFIRGAWAWIMAALILVIFDQLHTAVPQASTTLAILANQSLFTTGSVVRLFLFLAYGLTTLYIVLAWASEYYIIRDNSIIMCSGILSSTQMNYEMDEIEEVSVRQGWFSKIFDVGDVILRNPALKSTIGLYNISEPAFVVDKIQQLSYSWKKSMRMMNAPKPDPAKTDLAQPGSNKQ